MTGNKNSDTTSKNNLPQDFIEYKTKHPDFFPDTEPIGKQLKCFETFKTRERQRDAEREMSKVSANVDMVIAEQERLREYRAVSALSEQYPMQHFINAYSQSHIGHYQILRAVIYAECLKSSCTTKGLQPAVTGSRGSGKSHAVKTAVHLLPKDSVYTATLSPKALFYKKPEQKTTFYMDDAVLQDDLVSLMKRKQTQFQEPTVYGTVMDKKWAEISIDKRMVFITTSVSQLGDEQLTDRALLIDIKNEKADDEDFYKFENERRILGLPEFPETEEVSLCRDMLSHIRRNEFRVMMPSLDFAYYSDRRLIGQCYDLLEASAILNYKNREVQLDGDTIVVKATSDDLANAMDFDMFRFSDSDTLSRLSKSERAFDIQVQALLNGDEIKKYTEKELSDKTRLSVPGVRNYLYGRGNSALEIKDGVGLCGKTTWYKIDSCKDHITESIKNHIVICKHMYNMQQFAWIK
jgi:hypothetical protein